MIGAALRQVAVRAGRIPDETKNAFDKANRDGGEGLRLPGMVKLFINAIDSIELVYLCVDAVDEVLRERRPEFLRALRQITRDTPNLRLFLTGRSYIRGELDNYLPEGASVIDIVVDPGDITKFLSQKIADHSHQDPDLMTEDLKDDIMRTMLEGTSEM